MAKCRCSPDAFAYNDGLKGENADLTKILLVLHRSDSRALPGRWRRASDEKLRESYRRELGKSQTGRVLDWLLDYCGIGYDDVYLTNMYKCLLPGDRDPTREEYERCLSNLERQVEEEFSPRRIVVFGSKPYEVMFPEQSSATPYRDAVGSILTYHGVPALICWHPRWIWSMSPGKRNEEFKNVREFLEPALKQR